MREILIVVRREFLERVRTRSFVLSTLLLPLFVAGVTLLPAVLGRGGGERTLVVVDDAPPGVGEQVVEALTRPAPEEDEDVYVYQAERVAGPLAAVRDELNRRVLAEEIDGWVHLPADLVEEGAIDYRARNVSNFRVERDIRRAVSEAVQGARLRSEGLEVAEVASLLRDVEVRTARVTEQGEEAESARSTFFLGYILGFLVYFLVFLYGINVMRSVLEEKTNRIAEVIVSSMDAGRLMLGKVVGVGAVALLQVAIWFALGLLAASQSDAIARRFGLPPDAFSGVAVDVGLLLAAIGFFILGFFLYAALFAALGAAVTSEQEAQQLQMVVFLPLIVPMIFIAKVMTDPLGGIATALGLIPFTAPVTMPMRLTAAPVPAWEIAVSLAGIAVTLLGVAWLAGKIYRIGILSTGTKPTLRELLRWLRTA